MGYRVPPGRARAEDDRVMEEVLASEGKEGGPGPP